MAVTEAPAQYSADVKRACAEREVRQREKVYPRLIAKGTMTQYRADQEIAVMREIAADYAKAASRDDLFGGAPDA